MTANKRNWILLIVGFCILSTFCCCSGNPIPGEDVVVFLMIGWVIFLTQTLPQVQVRWDLAVNAMAYVTMFIVGCHYLLRWLHREMHRTVEPNTLAAMRWQWKWTLSVFIVIALMFATGLATTGALRHTGWILASDKGIYESYYERRWQERCLENLKSIGGAMSVYAADHQGRLPESLAELKTCIEEDKTSRYHSYLETYCEAVSQRAGYPRSESQETQIQDSYLYFGKGMGPTTDPHAVVVADRIENHRRIGKGINVLYQDGSFRWLEGSDAEFLLKSLNLSPTTQPR